MKSETRTERNKRYRSQWPEKSLLRNARHNAKVKGVAFDLTIEDVTIPDVCPILNIPISFTLGKRSDNSPSLDRIVCSGGYTKDNVVVCSWRANRLKSDAQLDELVKIANFMEAR